MKDKAWFEQPHSDLGEDAPSIPACGLPILCKMRMNPVTTISGVEDMKALCKLQHQHAGPKYDSVLLTHE